MTLLVYAPAFQFAFVNYDDDVYVTANPHVLQGVTASALRWAATATYGSNWHPATWGSHMIDAQLFGRDAGKHHASSVFLHAANVVLLFFLLIRLTGAAGRSAFVAALFAVHPLHVESVAWIAERKDVLSTLFWLLTSFAWLRFLDRRSSGRYALVLFAYAAGLASKPMLVTLPFTLMLLDFWPLGRRGEGAWPLVREKLPLFVLAAASCAVTILAQSRGGALQGLTVYPLDARVANALVSYAVYLRQMVWPASLAVLYPFAAIPIPSAAVLGSAALLAGLTWGAVAALKRAPYLLFGWLWFAGTLIPVLGLVQVGGQARADRYTYVPSIGLFIAFAWGACTLLSRYVQVRRVFAVAAVAALAVVAHAQALVWKDSATLFAQAVRVTKDNALAHNNLGRALDDRGDVSGAVTQFREAVRIAPDYGGAWLNLGNALAATGELTGATEAYSQAAGYSPPSPRLQNVLGAALSRAGRSAEAVEAYERAAALAPQDGEILNNLGLALAALDRGTEAIDAFTRAAAARPADAEIRSNLGVALARAGRMAEAIPQFEEVVRLNPGSSDARANLAAARASLGR